MTVPDLAAPGGDAYEQLGSLYDVWCESVIEDLAFYLDACAGAEGPIVELGVGSGRVAYRGVLSGNVSTTGKLTLKYLGKPVGSLKTGSYKVSVLDETSKAAFYLQRSKSPATKVSSSSFVGKHSVTLTLKAGQWFFYATPGKKTYFIVHN